MPNLSKSKFISGLQCPKKLYFDFYRKDLKPPVSEAQQALFNAGHEVGELAKKVFPGGKDATPESYSDFSASIENTRNWVRSGENTIYEATFSAGSAFCMLDILHHDEYGQRWAIEVKNSTSVKPYHLSDAALQYWVMKKSGCRPHRFYLMHINNQYVRQGEIEPDKLFHLEDITEKVIELQGMVEEKLPELQRMLQKKQEPEQDIGSHCSSPFPCDYINHCWKHIPENSVFGLHNSRGKEWELYNEGILELKDIPESMGLNHRQKLQVEGIKLGSKYIDHQAISSFLDEWQYPLYFFDFETVFPVLPLLDGTRPYQQIPFQYSLHIINEPGAAPEHREFLAQAEDFSPDSDRDPLRAMLDQIKQDIGDKGSIVAYNASFEKGRLKFLKKRFPEDADFVNNLQARIVDLYVPFRSGWFYQSEMNGSASIKSVLPAMAPEFSYSDLEIGNGDQASSTFLQMVLGHFKGDIPQTRQHLLEYCKLDSLAMIVVWEKLLEELKA